MFDIKVFDGMSTESKLENMLVMLEGLIDNEDLPITKLCNASALINALVGRINWCGFYLAKSDSLVLGPFQGMPACTKIEIGKGVCGTAALKKETLLIEDVHNFEGHIACDAASNSEIVIPIVNNEKLVGVLDLDSEEYSRFTDLERIYLEKAVTILNKYINWEHII
ncbi:GAF domain-containing protein [Clostridium chromiireducens]|uniref:Free methionine-R-sulfoxide reductase n=1 Tax=Clostridium chromiireducens TaxID=225345 RepID=A0A1V4IA75_9CLOT|nr:GAF domain-containing protein [Clostridium chromiireducens]OPJ56535.1 free methionine-R-sulfoxide reductase [Clostridium chromiireducens]